MKILVLGADGYLGWPTCMHLSKQGHDVVAVDSYFKRKATMELDAESLFPIRNLSERARFWKRYTDREIQVQIGDAADYSFLSDVFERIKPDAVIHYAEQPSAPYSMIDQEKGAFTLQNNLMSTFNIIQAVKAHAPECHIVKLGTMGEYGTPDIDIEEGWIEIEHKGRKGKFLFPRQAGSLYHTTKIQDTDLLWFYVRTWGLKVTDLMQGPVYGVTTDEIDLGEELHTGFHYDEVFGTVLNRFVVQAIVDHPLTVYGKGTQIRGYLNLKDTMACLKLAVENPAKEGELRIFNQFTETFSVNELAERVCRVGESLGYSPRVESLQNPRVEKEEHRYEPAHTGLLELGLEPHLLTDDVLKGMFAAAKKYGDRIRRETIFNGISWK